MNYRTYVFECSAVNYTGEVVIMGDMEVQVAARISYVDKCEAANETDAKIIATDKMNSRFPECQGWLNHRMQVYLIPPDVSAEIAEDGTLVLKTIQN